MPELRVEGVTKRFGKVLAVDNVSFSASPGRILGLLGPNGAGKTTIIRMIAYITVPDTGKVLFGEKEVGPWSQQRMGYLPEERGLYRKMKVGEQLVYFGELKGLSRRDATSRVKHWLDRFDASDWYGRKTNELSKGMQQKIQFVTAVLHDPELVILDEPFGGLDPINAEVLQNIIMEMKDAGRTILFASHRMEQVEQLCDDICLISQGKIVVDGALKDIKKSFGRNTVLLDFDGPDSFLDDLESRQLVRINVRSKSHAEIRLLNDTNPRLVLDEALRHTQEISRFELVEPSMREIFVTAVTEQQGAEAIEA
ncbi:MAG: ATP-binding cassette domain-containing protein [Bacteroidetes bacterium]|nr:MAG: ATP-binding cassette domain-containing protein [Bacteroidota bacterium]